MSVYLPQKNSCNDLFRDSFASKLILKFSTRHNGDMSLRYGDKEGALLNRKEFLGSLKIDYRSLVCAKQVHAANVKQVKKIDLGSGALSYDTAIADTDGLITNELNLPLAIFVADCLPVFIYDSRTNSIGLVHAGWRSTQKNIVSKTLVQMQKAFGARTDSVFVGFGPAIRSCCYEVGVDFKDFFPADLIENSGRLFLSLADINKKQLIDYGVKKENIFDCGVCTACRNDEYFSYRKESANCGRMISVMMLI